jgi:uracil-DNA glycosylase family 4
VRRLALVHAELTECRACARLVRWRERVASEKRARYKDEEYWGRPVPGFGDANAELVIVGLAPGAHGANRTGRIFTGDRSGDFLYAALARARLANQPTSAARDDGLLLTGAFITMAGRCAPPDNAPTRAELKKCEKWLDAELDCLQHARIFLALGAVAWTAMLGRFLREGLDVPRPRPRFAHGARLELGSGHVMFGSYHVSQQNTQTGRLTEAMFDEVLALALKSRQTPPRLR